MKKQLLIILSIFLGIQISTKSLIFTGKANVNYDNVTFTDDSLKIAYIGNMGVLIRVGKNAVIIDGFHKKTYPKLVVPSIPDVNKLINGEYYNYPPINIALVTHKHKDHFDGDYIKEFLNKNGKSIVIGTSQISEAMDTTITKKKKKVFERIKKIPYDGIQHEFVHKNIKIEAFRTDHSNSEKFSSVENVSYIVKIDNFSILHLGDSNWKESGTFLKNQKLKTQKLDVAIIPYWMLFDENAKTKINELLAPKIIIAAHIPMNISEEQVEHLNSVHPNVVLFLKKGEEFLYK